MASTRSAGFLGKGASFPWRLNKNTGGIQVSEGYYDSVSVAVSYFSEKWNMQYPGVLEETTNHVAESIYHILFTDLRSFEEIPWFGSKIRFCIFEPSSAEFKLIFQAYMSFSSSRWEKRAKIPETGIQWYNTGVATDRGELPLVASVEYITQQHPKNLVLPFVSNRQARTQEYPASVIDNNGHDLISRYYRQATYHNGTDAYIRLRRNVNLPPAPDDTFYQVKPGDTWMLIAYDRLDEVRYWFYPYLCYIQDNAKIGGTRDILNPTTEPEPGILLRIPSKERILLLNSRR
jgi:phage baseplate assembly protein W